MNVWAERGVIERCAFVITTESTNNIQCQKFARIYCFLLKHFPRDLVSFFYCEEFDVPLMCLKLWKSSPHLSNWDVYRAYFLCIFRDRNRWSESRWICAEWNDVLSWIGDYFDKSSPERVFRKFIYIFKCKKIKISIGYIRNIFRNL